MLFFHSASSGVSNEIVPPQSLKRSKRKDRQKNAKQISSQQTVIIPIAVTSSATLPTINDSLASEAQAESSKIDTNTQDDANNVQKLLQSSTTKTQSVFTTTSIIATATLSTKPIVVSVNNNCYENMPLTISTSGSNERTEGESQPITNAIVSGH